jgi:hypothetical protein
MKLLPSLLADLKAVCAAFPDPRKERAAAEARAAHEGGIERRRRARWGITTYRYAGARASGAGMPISAAICRKTHALRAAPG